MEPPSCSLLLCWWEPWVQGGLWALPLPVVSRAFATSMLG